MDLDTPTLTLDEPESDERPTEGSLVFIIDGAATGRFVRPLDRTRMIVGRSIDSDVVLRDPCVSRKHVEIELTRSGVSLRRWADAAPVFVNERRVDSALLRAGDTVRLGSCRLMLRQSGAPSVLGSHGAEDRETIKTAPTPEPQSRDAGSFIGSSFASERLKKQIARVGSTDATVLLVGESGTGKSMVARLLHEASPRARAPFFVINCAAIPEQLIESELFGHTRGAFTGAVAPRVGVFEAAADGTIFLDEIAELPLTSQAKLLRVLEERHFQRVGSTRAQEMKARVIAATNRDLARMVEEGQLRADLFYRLSVVQLQVPALRDRGDDVALLAEQIVHDMARRHRRRIDGFAPDALEAVRSYAWPGNVRELRNVIESAVVLGEGPLLHLEDLPTLSNAPAAVAPACAAEGNDHDFVRLPTDLASLESRAIEAALRATSGNRTRAASLLGINRVTLYKKLRQPSDGDAAEGDDAGDEPATSLSSVK